MSGHTSVFWGCLPITKPCESRGRVMLESTNHESIVPICGGNAETDLLALVVGQFVVFRPFIYSKDSRGRPLSGLQI